MCDHDVDARVAGTLRRLGHHAWTVGNAGLAIARDDDLTVYASEQNAGLLTHDVEFSERRRRNVSGWHLFLRCNEWDAAGVLERDLNAKVVPVLQRNRDLWVRLSVGEEPDYSYEWQ